MITRPFPRPSILSSMCSMRAEVEEDDRSRPHFLSGNNSSGRKNSRGLNIGDSIKDGGTIVGGGIVRGSQDIVRKVRGKSILNIGSRVAGRRHRSVNNPVVEDEVEEVGNKGVEEVTHNTCRSQYSHNNMDDQKFNSYPGEKS
ncbi:hypothetical protein Tco_0414758 [Tanacetum coccineum]